jgi:hypothetical protein
MPLSLAGDLEEVDLGAADATVPLIVSSTAIDILGLVVRDATAPFPCQASAPGA